MTFVKEQTVGMAGRLMVVLSVLVILVATANFASGQPLPEEWNPLDLRPVGNPEKVDLGEGKYKLVHKNRRGFVLRESVYEAIGSMIRVERKIEETMVRGIFSAGGKVKAVSVTTFSKEGQVVGGDDPPVEKEVWSFYDIAGALRKRYLYGRDPNKRTVTEWTPDGGAEGVSRREKLVAAEWKIDPTSPFVGKWRLEADGKPQAGEYTFAESPAITEIRHDSKVWLLMFGPNVEKRSVALPAESIDHLGFAKRLIQLRGNAEAGRLEFWLTPDLTTPDFQTTKYTLVREDN